MNLKFHQLTHWHPFSNCNSPLYPKIETNTDIVSLSSTRSTTSSIFALLDQHAQPKSFISENLLCSLAVIPLSLRFTSGNETSLTILQYPRSTHLTRDPESVYSLCVLDTADLPYQTLEENFRPLTPDPYHYPMRRDNQIKNQRRQGLKYQNHPGNRIDNKLQFCPNTRNGELTSLTQTSIELQFEVTVKPIGIFPHPLQTSP